MGDLKPCPCCQSDYVERECDSHIFSGQTYSDRYPAKVATQNHGFRVRCGSCGIQTCWWHYESEADEAWNTRTNTDEVTHLKETIHTVGFLLADEKAEVARLRKRLRINVKFMGDAAKLASKSGGGVVTAILELEIEQSSQLLSSKGPVDGSG